MSYDVSDIQTYQWTDATFGATTVTHNIIAPKGKVGFVREISVDLTTAAVGTTSVPEIDVGLASADSTYGRYRLGTTATTGYATGAHSASAEAITGNPPRTLADFVGHVILDGGPLSTKGSITGGSSTTQYPSGRIPAGGFLVTNVINGTANVDRVFLNGTTPAKDLTVGQTVSVQGVVGVNATINAVLTISAIDTVNFQWIELTGTTFSGTYTGGGIVNIVVVVTAAAGAGGATGGAGTIRVKIQWLGAETP